MNTNKTAFEPIGVSRITQIISLIDLTNLSDNCDDTSIETLCAQASTSVGNVAALCVWPSFVSKTKKCLGENSPIKIATVVNFPNGDDPMAITCDSIETAIDNGADEIDYVLPYAQMINGNYDQVKNELYTIRNSIPRSVKLKVILETGVLEDSRLIHTAASLAIDQGADFVKTSTGKVPVNATFEAADVILKAIRFSQRDVGFKAAGGIKTVEAANQYLNLAEARFGQDWIDSTHFRLGASSLLQDALNKLNVQSSGTSRNGDDY